MAAIKVQLESLPKPFHSLKIMYHTTVLSKDFMRKSHENEILSFFLLGYASLFPVIFFLNNLMSVYHNSDTVEIVSEVTLQNTDTLDL